MASKLFGFTYRQALRSFPRDNLQHREPPISRHLMAEVRAAADLWDEPRAFAHDVPGEAVQRLIATAKLAHRRGKVRRSERPRWVRFCVAARAKINTRK